MKENELWNFFLLTGNVDGYLTYRRVKELHETEFAKEDEVLTDGESNGDNNKNS